MRKFFIYVFIINQLVGVAQSFAKISINDSNELNLVNTTWLYNSADNVNFHKKEFDDSKWLKTKSSLNEREISKLNFKGFAWFRQHIFIDSNLKNTPLVIVIEQKGASEIYLNGSLIAKIGIIGKTESDEERNTGESTPIFISPIYEADNVIAIKYSNKSFEHSYTQNGEITAGFIKFTIQKSIVFYNDNVDNILRETGLGLGLFIFFATIGLIHFLLYLFYKEKKSNLYFTLFCLLYAYYFLHLFLTEGILSNPGLIEILNLLVYISVVFFFIILLTVLYSLLYPKFPKQYKYFLISAVILSIGSIFIKDIFFISLLLAIVILIEIVRVLIIGLKNKVKGIKIIGAGFGFFSLFLIYITIFALIKSGIIFADNLLFTYLFILAIISIPLSMSIFLAWDFSQTSKNLKSQLLKNEELFQQTITQQKEKQELLANQNKVLEEQVIERTQEINLQKKELQLKNTEITDSINYSKHIQLALLPDEEDILNALPNCFILYQPKDIVSGDFYWFKDLKNASIVNNKSEANYSNSISSILIAAADCTGHGVPGALMSLIAIENLNKAVEFETEPHKLLELVNKNVKNALKQNTDNAAKDGLDIALCKIDKLTEQKYKVSYSAANRPLYIIKNNQAEVIEFKATKHAIGGHTDYNQIFEQHIFEFNKGDSIYLFSDGYADQFGSDKNKKLTTKRFKELLLDVNSLLPNEQKKYLYDYVTNWKGKLEQIDDILIIGLKF